VQSNLPRPHLHMVRIALLVLVWLFVCNQTSTRVFSQRLEIDDSWSTAVYRGEGDWLTYENLTEETISRLAKIQRFELFQHEIVSSEITFLETMAALKEVQLGVSPDFLTIAKNALPQLQNLDSIETLEIAMEDITDGDLTFLQGMSKTLRTVLIDVPYYPTGRRDFGEGRFSLTDECGEILKKVDSLEEISINGGFFSDKLVVSLAELPNLKRLVVVGKFGDDSLSAITTYHPALNMLTLKSSGTFSGEGLMHFGKCSSLIELEIIGKQHWSKDAVAKLKEMDSLRVLKISGDSSFEYISSLAALNRLKHLTIRGPVELSDFAEFNEQWSLETITLSNASQLKETDFSVFSSIPNLKCVVFEDGPIKEICIKRR